MQTQPPTALEASIERLCAERGLSAISFAYNYDGARSFCCFVHRGGKCAAGNGHALGEAIVEAISDLEAETINLADEALPQVPA